MQLKRATERANMTQGRPAVAIPVIPTHDNDDARLSRTGQ